MNKPVTKTFTDPLAAIIPEYITVEQKLLARVREVCLPVCSQCAETCCAEQYCREALDSPFLSRLVNLQALAYDPDNGWLGGRGCRLEYGRPMVCYEFFCRRFLDDASFMSSDIRDLIKAFINIGRRARGTGHLICVADPAAISPSRIVNIRERITALNNRLSGMPVETQVEGTT